MSTRLDIPTAAVVFGALFLLAGILGFWPVSAPGGYLFGLFHVNAVHNVIHIVTGAVALWVGLKETRYAELFFQVFGIIYLLVALLGVYYGDRPIFGLIANNWHDVWFHFVVAAAALFLGFYRKCCNGSALE